MVSRQIIRPGDVNDVLPHEHAATDITGTFNFVRILKALIDGSLKITGQLTAGGTPPDQSISIRPSGDNLVPSLVFWSGISFAHHEAFIEIRDQGGGVWGLVIASPTATAGQAATIQLNSDGGISVEAPSGISLPSVLTLQSQDDTDEGGQIVYDGAGAHSTTIATDRFQDVWRVLVGANAPLQVSDTATIVAVEGSEIGRFVNA